MTSILWNINLENSFNIIYENTNFERPMNVIEIGCFEGFGTLKLNDLFCSCENSSITCIDPWDDVYVKDNNEFSDIDPIFVGQYDKFLQNTKNISDKIIIKKGYSNEILPILQKNFYDFVYIDGDHSESQVYLDGVYSFDLVKNGGVILFDDYNWQHKSQITKNGIERFISEFNNKITILFRGPVQCAIIVNNK